MTFLVDIDNVANREFDFIVIGTFQPDVLSFSLLLIIDRWKYSKIIFYLLIVSQ